MKKLLFSIIFIFSSFIFSKVDLKPSGFLNDYAGILKQSEKQNLETYLEKIEKETTNEIAVVIIKSLEGRNLEEFSNELFNTWKIGKKDKDNGVLILISLTERKIRIEVGYGLEPYLTDATCGRIIRRIMAPEFRKRNYYRGIKKAVESIDKLTRGEKVPLVEKKNPPPPASFLFFWFGFLIFFAFGVVGLLGVIIQGFVIGILLILYLLNKSNPSGEFFLLLSILTPFFLNFIFFFIAATFLPIFQRRLKKYYGNRWRQHWPVFLGSPGRYTGTSSGGGFSSGGFGGFGGGCSGGGGASGGW